MIARLLRSQVGNAPLELVLVAPLLLMVIGLVIAAGRVSTAQEAVDAAAHDAARQASVAANEGLATDAALSSAASALSADGLQCQPVVSLPGLATAFNTPIGRSATVHALVICVVRLSDVLVPGVPGTITLHARFASPLDPFRSRDLSFLIPEVPDATRSG